MDRKPLTVYNVAFYIRFKRLIKEMDKRILVLGGGGMLGHKVCELLPAQGFDVYAAFRKLPAEPAACYQSVHLLDGIDVLNDTALKQAFAQSKPDVVINCIGIVKQINEAYDRYLSVAINAFLPHRLNRLCQEYGARLIHISTDCVFDGKRGRYQETDLSDAEDLYGKSKYLGETDETETNAVTLRTSIIGPELKTNTHGLLGWMLEQEGKTIKGFKKALFTGFTTAELTRIMTVIIKQQPSLSGLYQVASNPINKFDLLTLINDIYKLNVTIVPDENFVCDRSLVMQRFTAQTGYVAPSWEKMIMDMYNQG